MPRRASNIDILTELIVEGANFRLILMGSGTFIIGELKFQIFRTIPVEGTQILAP